MSGLESPYKDAQVGTPHQKMFFLFLIGVTSGRFIPHAEINIYPNEGEKIETKLRITVRSTQRKYIKLIINLG